MKDLLKLASFKPEKTGREIEFKTFKFPGGESHIQIDPSFLADEVVIETRLNTGDDVMLLLLAVDALKRLGSVVSAIYIPYLPYARQDRVCNVGEPLSIKVIGSILNSLNTDIIVLDPHSDVSSAIIDNCRIVSNKDFVYRALNHRDDVYLVSPDQGSLKKCQTLIKQIPFAGLIQCSKIRETATGRLVGFQTHDLVPKKCMIVDDICDGGGTFNGLGDVLKQQGCEQLELFVTHGIFSQGFDELIKRFTHIYTTNSYKELESAPYLTQYKV